ncbi:MAG: hypothetical protein IJU93_10310 [Lachnospiraceae bacterium]|nr:hypothetical protein [Lachnospiraceae bacterium]
MAPKVKGFANAYVKDVKDIREGTIDESLRSFMDKGEAAFEDEEFDGKSRRNVILAIRKNVLERMREENRASEASADKISAQHAKLSGSLLGKIVQAKNLRRDIKRNDAQYMAIHGKHDTADREWALQYLDNIIADMESDQEADRQTLQDAQEAAAREEEVEFELEGLEEPGSAEDTEGPEAETETQEEEAENPLAQEQTLPGEQDQAEEQLKQQQETMSDLRHQHRAGARTQERGGAAADVSEASINERQADIEFYKKIRDEIQATDPGSKSRIAKMFQFAGIRSWSNRKKNDKKQNEYTKLVAAIKSEAAQWADVRNQYAENVYRQHYEKYDNMAKTWYEITQEYALDGSSEEEDHDKMLERAIPLDAVKNIAEYTGVFDIDALNGIMGRIEGNPYMNVKEIPITESKKTRAGADEQGGNEADLSTHRKYHRKIVMYSQAGENGLKTRMKFRYDFKGNRSKRQFTEDEPTALSTVQNADEDYFKQMYASDANLESDETDINGNKLHSEKSMEMLSARGRWFKKLHGFYLNGEYFSDEEQKEGKKLLGKNDVKSIGRVNWKKQDKAEKLRVAIRQSAFFQHVNAATIQYYASYDGGDDTASVRYNLEKLWEDKAKDDEDLNRVELMDKLTEDPSIITEEVDQELWAGVAYDYIRNKLNPDKAAAKEAIKKAAEKKEKGEEGEEEEEEDDGFFPEGAPLTDKLIEKIKGEKEVMVSLCSILLADDDPRMWNLARKIVEDGGEEIVAKRTISKMSFLPKEGEMMRRGLLDELMNHQDDPSEDVEMEELQNKRGAGAWFKRNLMNGKIVKEAMDFLTLGFSPEELVTIALGGLAGEGGEGEEEGGEAEGGEEGGESADANTDEQCKESFEKTQSEGSFLESLLGGGEGEEGKEGGEGGEASGEEKEEKEGEEGELKESDITYMFAKIKDTVKKIWGGIKGFYNKYLKKKTGEEEQIEEQRKREQLQDKDLTTLRSVLRFLDSLLAFGDNMRKKITKMDGVEGTFLGTIQQYTSPLQWVFETGRNLIGIVNDICEIIVTTKRINRIDAADSMIETAITEFNQSKGESIENGADSGAPKDRATIMQEAEKKRIRDMGEAAEQNSQAQYFMALTKASARKNRSQAGWDIGVRALNIAKGTTKQLALKGEMGSFFATIGLHLASKTTQFIGWVVGKLKYDRSNFNDNIAAMLGDKEYAKTPYFDRVLKRETGIVSKNYLVDLARIFTSIDTHVLLNKDTPDKSNGEKELAKQVVGTLYGNATDENVRNVEFRKLLAYSGFSADSDWRTLLRNSIAAGGK